MKVEAVIFREGEQACAVINATVAGDKLEDPIKTLRESIIAAVNEWALSSDAGANVLEDTNFDMNIADVAANLDPKFAEPKGGYKITPEWLDPDTLEYHLRKNGILEMDINLYQSSHGHTWNYDSYVFTVDEEDVAESKEARDAQTQKRISD